MIHFKIKQSLVVLGFCLVILDAVAFTLLYEAQFYKSLKSIYDISRTIFAEPTCTALFFTGSAVGGLVLIAFVVYGFFNFYKQIKDTKTSNNTVVSLLQKGTPIKNDANPPMLENYFDTLTDDSDLIDWTEHSDLLESSSSEGI